MVGMSLGENASVQHAAEDQCSVAFACDVDMPESDECLHKRGPGWPWNSSVHGRVDGDVAGYVRRLAGIAGRRQAR